MDKQKAKVLNDFFDFLNTTNISYNFFNDTEKELCPDCSSDDLYFDKDHDTFECGSCGALKDNPIHEKELFDLSTIIEMFVGDNTMYMNPDTGSVDTYDEWYYEDENGEIVNAVDLDEVIEVIEQDDCWIEV